MGIRGIFSLSRHERWKNLVKLSVVIFAIHHLIADTSTLSSHLISAIFCSLL